MSESDNKSIRIQLISDTDEFSLLEEKWNTVLSDSTANSIFLRWEWLYYWWIAYKEDNYKLVVVIVFREDKIIGIAPFYIANVSCMGVIPVRRLLFLGTKEGDIMSEFMDIICNPGDEDTVIKTVIEFIIQENICDDFYLQKIKSSSKTISLFMRLAEERKLFFIIHEEYESPFVRLPSTMDDFLHGLSSSMRYKIRKNRRKLDKYSHVEFRKTSDSSELERDFEELVRLHQLRWKSKNHPGSFADKSFFLFQKTVMTHLLKNGYLDLWLLSVGDKNICANYNIRQNGKIYTYQSGIDTSFDASIAPGYLLHSYCIENAIQHGFSEYHFLLMGHFDAYKKRWANNTNDLCDIYIALTGVMKVLMTLKYKARNYYHSLRKNYAGLNS
jgi:hypothetical protein